MTTTVLECKAARATTVGGVIPAALLKAAELSRSTAIGIRQDHVEDSAVAARCWNTPGAGPDASIIDRWLWSPDGQLITAWEATAAPAISPGAEARAPAERPFLAPPRERREENVWVWFIVAGLAAGYVLTGVAYFLG